MWTPRERIRHPLPETRWPTAEEAADALWFRPVRVGPVTLRERTWVPAMVPWRATEEGFVTDAVLSWYERFARGRPGAIVVEATGIRDIPSGPLLRIGHDRFLPGLERLVETVRKASEGETRLFIQILDFLSIKRRPPREKYFRRFWKLRDEHRERLVASTGESRWTRASDEEVRERLLSASDEEIDAVLDPRELEDLRYGARERVTDVELPHIRDLPRVLPPLFADAASRARRAGFDGVELHYAHAYTMASFLSRRNDRVDGYGGSSENRLRLPLEVYREVRARVGPEFVVGCRILGDEVIAGGSRVEDAKLYAVELARAGMDYVSVSKGGKFEDAKMPDVGWAAYPYTGESGYECMPTVYSDARGPFGRNIPLAAAIRRKLRAAGLETPIVASGGIGTFELAESILRNGEADIVAAARQSLADPDWFRKIRLGRGSEVRRCAFTNYCEALDQKHREVTCKLWDRVRLDEPGVALDESGKRRLVAPDWS
jgi:2,4-dienoyl-CoA reductase-like NADH-dependent reductase (Old Yellow Enzyme family)